MTIATTSEFLRKLVRLHVRASEDLRTHSAAASHESAAAYASALGLQDSIAKLLREQFDFRAEEDKRTPQYGNEAILLLETTGSVRLERFKLVEFNDYSREVSSKRIGWTQETDGIRKTLIAYAY